MATSETGTVEQLSETATLRELSTRAEADLAARRFCDEHKEQLYCMSPLDVATLAYLSGLGDGTLQAGKIAEKAFERALKLIDMGKLAKIPNAIRDDNVSDLLRRQAE